MGRECGLTPDQVEGSSLSAGQHLSPTPTKGQGRNLEDKNITQITLWACHTLALNGHGWLTSSSARKQGPHRSQQEQTLVLSF